ncbi:MAG TPA: immunoglobulin domain-containing protein [Verrucomicrobiae bacterium]|nr:immunoglobulin domain-containing protein [Verrucomicrobiae bacterium]
MKIKHFATKIVLAQLIMMVCASIASAQIITLLGYTNQTWRYNDTSTSASNPQSTFMTPSFDDSVAGWKTGFPLFGNDDSGVYNGANQPFRGGVNGFATPLDRSNGRVTFYFRTHFNLATAPSASATLFSTNYLDDGAVFYINGVDVGRTRVPGGVLTWDTLGSNPTEGAPTRIDMPISALQVGDNVVAVEVHQSAATSSDVAFAMNLILINPFCVQISDSTQPADTSVVQSRPFTLRAVANGSPPVTYQWVKDNADIPGANSDTYTVAQAALSDEGNYYCRVTNPECTVNSRTAFVDVIPDETAPLALQANGGPAFDRVIVQFSEAMDPTTAQDPYNFGITDDDGNTVDVDSLNPIIFSSDQTVVTIVLAPGVLLQEDAVYHVLISGVADVALNLIADTNVTFRTFTSAGCRGFLFEAFDTSSTPGNAVSLLTSHPNYPNNPRESFSLPSFDTRHVYPAGNETTREQFGGRVRGLFIPVISGPHRFYLASDDASQLFVNPSGPDSAGKQLVAQETGCCNNFMPAGDPKTSAALNLTAGQPYYVEALYKEGGGGDWLKVAARPASDPVPVGGNIEAGIVSPNVIQGSPAPAGVLSFVTIGSQPGNQNVIAGQRASFSVALTPDVPGCYQWKRDGVDIPGAVGRIYTIPAAAIGDDGAKFKVSVSLAGGTVLTSSEALLRVSNDTTPPTALSASTDAYGTNLTVVYSEVMDATTTANAANYQVDGGAVTITAATLVNPTTAQLSLGQALAGCVNHTVRITGVRDQFQNVIATSPTNLTFLAPLLLIPIDAVKTWRYDDTGADRGTAWRAANYDDSAWKQGVAVFAFETATLPEPIRTPLIDPRTLPTAGSANYFRTHFNLATDPATLTSLRMRYLNDDGMVVYINGTEVHRQSVPPAEIFSTFATRTVGDATVYDGPFDIAPSALVYGDNVIAVSVHNVNAGSSDTVFALELTGAASSCSAPAPRLSITRNGNQVTITSTAAGTIKQSSSLSGPWTPVGAAPQTVTIGPGNAFFEIRP